MFFCLVACVCGRTHVSEIGAHHVSEEVTPDDPLVINITYYPFYIVFYDVPETTVYHEFYSRSPERVNPRDWACDGANLPVYRAIELPYGQIVFNSTANDVVKFMYMSMPGMCQTGVFFSVAPVDSTLLNPSAKEFFKLGNYDDKCFVVGIPAAIHATIKMSADDASDIVYFYSGYYNYSAIASGSLNWRDDIGTSEAPVVVRLVTSRETPPHSFLFQYESSGGEGKGGQDTHIPRHRVEECEQKSTWYSEELIILLIVCSCFLVLLLVFMLICSYKQRKTENRFMAMHDMDR